MNAEDNRLRGLIVNGGGYATGITGMDPNQWPVDNSIIGQAGTDTVGVGIRKWTGNSGALFCSDNAITGFTTPMDDCTDDGGNVVH